MKTIIAFNTEEEIFKILGWPYTGDFEKDRELHEKLWDAGFNLDDWDAGFACREPLSHKVHDGDEDDDNAEWDSWDEWDDDVWWLGTHMDDYCCGSHHCEFEGWHWYTVHHA